MTKVDELAKLIEAETKLAESLCDVMMRKQQAIVKFDGDALALLTAREVELMGPLGELEAERARRAAELSASVSPRKGKAAGPVTLRQLARLLGAPDGTRISAFGAQLKRAVQTIVETNEQNRVLLHHSLQFVKETIRIVTDGHKRQLVDQRM